MPVIELPLTSDGERKFTTEIAGVSYLFRTTYVLGQQNHSVLDIFDANENPLVYGTCSRATGMCLMESTC